jgi:hypothetical protein
LLSQRLFWGPRLCGAKSKELGPTALKQLLIFIRLWRILRATPQTAFDFHPPLADFTRHFSWRLFPKILECRSQKTFNPFRLSSYSFFWDPH